MEAIFKICKLANFLKVDFYIIFSSGTYTNNLKQKTAVIPNIRVIVIFYWPKTTSSWCVTHNHRSTSDVSSLGFRGAVRALCHRRDASSRPTRHCDCVDAGFANGLATHRQLLHTIQYAAPLKLRQMPTKTLPAGR